MGKLTRAHLIETGVWIAIAGIGFYYSFAFDQPIEIYKFGASGWPRAVLILIVTAALGNLVWHYRYGDDYGNDGPGAEDQQAGTAAGADRTAATPAAEALQLKLQTPHEMDESRLSYYARIVPIMALPFLYAYLLEGVGFYALTPVFIVLVVFALGERSLAWLVGVTIIVYALLLFLFAKVLFVGLPVGTWHPFYDYGQWVIEVIQDSYVLEFFGLALLLPLTIFSIITAKGTTDTATAIRKAAMVYGAMFSAATLAAYLLGGPSHVLILFDVLKWPLSVFS